MINTNLHGEVLEIIISNPPVNALGSKVRQGLSEAVAAGERNPAVKAMVIRGGGKLFSGGADITEFEKGFADPPLPAVIDQIETCPKPIVAAIHGMALGGGLELAMGCHYRIAGRSAKLGLPEVKLGLLPGAGGTQRLPRLGGVETALSMIVSGDPVSASQLVGGLVDRIAADDELFTQAVAWARTLEGPRPTRALGVSAEPAAFDGFLAANSRKIGALEAPLACIEAIRASAEMPFDEGVAREAEIFVRLVSSAQSLALRHLFFAERAAAKIVGLPRDAQLRPVTHIGVIGAGTMGGGIAMNFLSAGIPVTIIETAQDALDRGLGVIRSNYEASAAKGRITTEQVEKAMALITPALDYAALSGCDLVIEAVYENLDLKKDIFRRLGAVAKEGAILASNTSFLDIDEIAIASERPGDVLGLHFFSPANVMKLLEVVRGSRTDQAVLATAMDIARRIGKIAVVAGVCYGFIGNRILLPRQDNATELLIEGATPSQVDKVHTDFGMPMGPFQMADLAGTDIGWHRDPTQIETMQDAVCAAGRLGQKTGAGYYDYDDRRRASPSPEMGKIIADFRKNLKLVPREIDDEEIMVRTLYVMVNEGAKILDEGIAQRSSDIDVVWIYGYGWPSYKGGPMYWADQVGLQTIVDGLNRYREKLGNNYSLSPMLERLAAKGATFGSM